MQSLPVQKPGAPVLREPMLLLPPAPSSSPPAPRLEVHVSPAQWSTGPPFSPGVFEEGREEWTATNSHHQDVPQGKEACGAGGGGTIEPILHIRQHGPLSSRLSLSTTPPRHFQDPVQVSSPPPPPPSAQHCRECLAQTAEALSRGGFQESVSTRQGREVGHLQTNRKAPRLSRSSPPHITPCWEVIGWCEGSNWVSA